jgi:hypothetical protein
LRKHQRKKHCQPKYFAPEKKFVKIVLANMCKTRLTA